MTDEPRLTGWGRDPASDKLLHFDVEDGGDAALEAEIARLREERDEARKFKAWVHAFLDGKQVPHDPDPTGNAEHGCRISGRMKWVFAQLTAAAEREQRVRALVAKWRDTSGLTLAAVVKRKCAAELEAIGGGE